jgi:hypothetical protein
MSQAGFTPIQLYFSTTAAATPSAGNLANGELALNITDGKLFYKDNGGVVQTLATKSSAISPVTNNGVVYVNGSGQATTGSALTFDGTNLGLQSATNAYAGSRNGATFRANSGNGFEFILQSANATAGTSGGFATAVTGNDVYFVNRLDGFYSWITGGSGNSEQMRLTSTGLGIGTSSPPLKLSLLSNVSTNNASTPVVMLGSDRTDYYASINSVRGSASTYLGLAFSTSNNALPAEVMRLDPAGNLGLGVTPSAWSGKTAITVLRANLTSGATGDIALTNNAFWNGSSWVYQTGTTQPAAMYQSDSQHRWYTAPSGTAGNAISFTQAMTLNASGNLGVGETSPTSRLHVAFTSNSVDNILQLQQKGNNTASGIILAANDNNGAGYNFIRSQTTGGTIHWQISGGVATSTMAFSTGGTERARITSGGDFLVGKTSDTFSAAGARISSGGVMTLTTPANELANFNRLTDDGILLYFSQDSSIEGSISVSGTTVSYNGGHLSRWAQTLTPKDDTLVKGTVLSNLDEMNVYADADGNPVENEQLNKVKVSDVEGDANVAGVFVNWTHDDAHNVDEINMAMTGDMIIRIAAGTTVARGDLLMSAGDGTAKPQGDDIVRSKTIAKVTSTHTTCTYADGSFCVPCVLMAC